jgi:tripartite-type tricarboxylate transporter receptor subunit TctC
MHPFVLAAFGAAALLPAPLQAQSYPVRPVRLVVPFAAGGPVDTVARLLTPRLAEAWGHQVVIDNRPGANSIIGSEAVARAAPDGYTLLIVSAGFAINVTLQPKLPYDALRDFTPITTVAYGPSALVTHPSLPARNLKELIALAKARPGQLTYGSSGVGAPTSHLGMELLKVTAGVDIVHVPYKSMAPALTDIIGGQVHMGMPTINVTVPHVRSGRLRALGVTSSTRSPAMPDVPPLAEVGMPGYEANNWTMLLGPAGLPAAIAEKIHADTARALQESELRERYLAAGMEARSVPFARISEFVRSEIAKWGKVVKASGARLEG